MRLPGRIFKWWLPRVVLLLCFILPRVVDLDRIVTPDEPKWLARSANFLQALVQRSWANTFQRAHPGVTVSWVGAFAYLLENPDRSFYSEEPMPDARSYFARMGQYGIVPIQMLESARRMIGLVISAGLLYALVVFTGLVGEPAVWMGFVLLAFDPFMLGLSRLFHLDALNSVLMLCSLLSWLGYQRAKKLPYLVISGGAAGLSWLTKSPAFFLFPFITLLVGVALYKTVKHDKKNWWAALPRLKLEWLTWLILAMLVFTFLWPAMWVDPLGTVRHVFDLASEYAIEGHDTALFFDGGVYKDGIPVWYFYLLAFLWRTTPAVLLGLLLVPLLTLLERRDQTRYLDSEVTWTLLAYSGMFILAISLAQKKFDRYMLPAVVTLDLAAGLGWAGFLRMVRERCVSLRYGKQVKAYAPTVIASTLIAGQIWIGLGGLPYYLSYYNPIMGGAKQAPAVMEIGWGEGLDLAADYLMGLPDHSNLRVYAWYGLEGFSFLFDGKVRQLDLNTTLTQAQSVDYVVIYVHQWQRRLPNPLILDYFASQEPVFRGYIGPIEYVRVYATN